MKVVKALLDNIGNFGNEEVILFSERVIERNFRKNEILLNEGDVCRSAFYIVSGEAFQFCYDDIDENIIDLHMENDWCLNHSSFVTQKPSTAIIKAYSGITVLELTITAVHELIAISPSFFQLGSVLEQTVSRVQYFDNTNTAEEKHKLLFSTRPQLFQKFPLKMIASYLKIAPETLSRIRGKK
jgi:CRP-like cAMP-binding protein